MKGSQFTDRQMVPVLMNAAAGVAGPELCCSHGSTRTPRRSSAPISRINNGEVSLPGDDPARGPL